MAPPDVSAELRLAGLRVTAPRRSVSQWLVEHPHATAEQIRAGVAEQLGSVTTTTTWCAARADTPRTSTVRSARGRA